MPNIRVSYELPRGCGQRKGGAKYIVSEGTGQPCGKLPLELHRCPTCDAGIKPARGWTWVDAPALFRGKDCSTGPASMDCSRCTLSNMNLERIGKAGLLWIGSKFYKTPSDWIAEGKKMGFSRRLAQIPREFKIGETYVLAAHREAIQRTCQDCVRDGLSEDCPICEGELQYSRPAIFHVWLPTKIEYIVQDDDDDEKLERLEDQGFSLVQVINVKNQRELQEV